MDEIRFKKEDGSISRCCNVEASNPILADKKDVEKLRGDAIGDTLYSESAVLKTLMCLSKFSVDDWSEELEEQLCFLWDMTFEKDVVAVLLKHHFTTLAYQAIQTSSEPRFVEILIGILGNMTAVKEVRLLLSQSCYIELFLSLLSSSDARTLLQLVRLLNSCVWHVNSTISSLEEHDEDEIQDSVAEVEVWISHMKEGAPALNEHLSFILRSSVNEELLLSTLELLNNLSSLKYKSDSGNKFLSLPVLLQGLIEALHQLLGLKEDSALVTIAWDDRVEKAAHHWTLTLSSFSDTASDFLYDQRKVVMRSICSILDPLILHENIFPLNSRKLDIMDVVQEILHAFQVKHNYSPPAILPRLLTILDHLSPKQASHDSLHPEEMLDFLNNGDQERPTELCNNIFEYCLTIMCHTETEDFLEAFGDNPIPKVTILLSNLSSSKNSDMHKLANVIQRYLS